MAVIVFTKIPIQRQQKKNTYTLLTIKKHILKSA